jgi:anti-sigma28 factor (negative regulator of flagellin synthesis)
MPSLWTESYPPFDVDDSEEPAIRARRIVESEAKRAAADCARMPEIRMDLVRAMRGRLAAGEYNISAGDLADAIIRSATNAHLCR